MIFSLWILSLTLGAPFLRPVAGNSKENLMGIRFGRSVLALSDLDGDGVCEFAVGAPAAAGAGLQAGLVLVFSGAERKVIQEWHGEPNRSHFGHSLRAAGDVNADGRQDVLVGYEFAAKTEIRSGLDGALLLAFDRDQREVFALGDADRDGSDDLLLHANGTLEVRSGRSGSLLAGKLFLREYGPANPMYPVGDVDGDGLTDLVLASKSPVLCLSGRKEEEGRLDMRLFQSSGRTPLKELWPADFARPELTIVTAQPAGDLNADGAQDIVMTVEVEKERVVLGLSIQHPKALLRIRAGSRGGHALLGSGDLNGDGFRDVLLIETPQFCTDVFLRAHSGADGSELWRTCWRFRQSTLGLSLASLPATKPGEAAQILVGGSDWYWHGRVSRDGGLKLFAGPTGKELWRLNVADVRPLLR